MSRNMVQGNKRFQFTRTMNGGSEDVKPFYIPRLKDMAKVYTLFAKNRKLQAMMTIQQVAYRHSALPVGVVNELRSVTLYQFAQMPDDCLNRLVNIQSLRHLFIADCANITDVGLMYLTRHLGLKTLTLGGVHQISQAMIETYRQLRPETMLGFLS